MAENKEEFPERYNGFSRDLLQRFINGKDFPKRFGREERINSGGGRGEDGELELSLGLSLNGKFGVDPTRISNNKLMRSSSVSHDFMMLEAARVVPIDTNAPRLTKTCSLPVENEEECRKRKELQSLRRMEAKRRRMEKLKVVGGGDNNNNNNKVVDSSEENYSCEENGSSNVDSSSGQDSINNSGNYGMMMMMMPVSQGSIGSHGSGSSGLSELESTQFSVQVKKSNEAGKLPSSMHLQNEQKPANSPAMATKKSATLSGDDKEEMKSKDMMKNVVASMPCVSTTGNGPNGKKIDGFLYRYGKGEEVSIVCVCHGSFLSPADFVKHAGGGDVEHPLRHIVVNSSPFL